MASLVSIDNNNNVDDITLASLSLSNNTTVNVIAASALPFPKDGIRLSSIKDFYDSCGGKFKLEGLTTTDVNEKYQKPITSDSQLSYCEYLKLQNNSNVGVAVVFISHGTTTTTYIIINTSTYNNIDINTYTTIIMIIP